VRDELNRLAAELKARLPEHTYKAVIRRAKSLHSDEARLEHLTRALANREESEAATASPPDRPHWVQTEKAA